MAKKRIKKVVEVGGLLRGPFSYIWHQGLPSSMSCHCECTCTRALFMKKKKHFFLVNTHFGYGRFCSGWKIHFYSMVCCKVYFEYRTSYIKDTSNLQNNLILIKDDWLMRPCRAPQSSGFHLRLSDSHWLAILSSTNERSHSLSGGNHWIMVRGKGAHQSVVLD